MLSRARGVTGAWRRLIARSCLAAAVAVLALELRVLLLPLLEPLDLVLQVAQPLFFLGSAWRFVKNAMVDLENLVQPFLNLGTLQIFAKGLKMQGYQN